MVVFASFFKINFLLKLFMKSWIPSLKISDRERSQPWTVPDRSRSLLIVSDRFLQQRSGSWLILTVPDRWSILLVKIDQKRKFLVIFIFCFSIDYSTRKWIQIVRYFFLNTEKEGIMKFFINSKNRFQIFLELNLISHKICSKACSEKFYISM